MKRVICQLLLIFRLGIDGNEFNVHLGSASNLRLGVFTNFNAGLAVGRDDVASYIRF